MKKKLSILLAVAALSIASVAMANTDPNATAETTSTTTADCGSRPTRPAAGATAEQMAQFRTDTQTYFKCVHPNGGQGGQFRGRMNGGDNATFKADRQENMDQKCQMIQKRIDEKTSNFDSNNAKRMAVFTNMQDRISKFITRLSGEGYDTSKVQADLDILKQKIQQFETDKQAQIAKLGETKDFTCGHSDGEFMGKLGESRSLLMTVHKDAMDIRQFMLTTVRPDIMALRKLKMDANTSTTTTTTENN